MRLVIGDRRLTLEDLINITRKGYKIEISEKAYERVAAARELVDRYVKEKKVSYGITTGFGKFSDTVISEAVFPSASNEERFFQMLTEEIMVERAYSIGKKTTEALKKKNVMNICESEESTYESVVSLITKK